jgi:HAD superfamily hydrolase (TIGR01458 family)
VLVVQRALGVDGLLIDIDGVLTTSWRPLPGAIEFLDWMNERRIAYRLLTNTTELSRNSLVKTLRDAGFRIDVDKLVTAPTATAAYVRANHPKASCFVIGADAAREDLDGIEIVDGDGDVVLVGGVSGPVRWDDMNRALRLVLGGAPLIAMHRSMTWMTDEGLVMDGGVALVAALEEATGVQAVVCGKPAPACFTAALDLMGLPAERAAMVGDDIVNDVLAAQNVGVTGVLVKTGKFQEEALERAQQRPDFIIEAIADLSSLLG